MFRLILLICLLNSHFSWAQSTSQQVQRKPKIPIFYLNQYLEYNITDDESISIGDLEIYFKALSLSHNSRSLRINELFNKKISGNLELYDSQNKLINKVKVDDTTLEQNFDVSLDDFKQTNYYCFYSKNIISSIKVCKSINNEKLNYKNRKITFDDLNVDSESGKAILTVPQKYVNFKIQYDSKNYILISTRKRVFAVLDVEKDFENKKYRMNFSDRELPETDWSSEIAFEQEYFTVPYDDIVTVKQDYIVSDKSEKDVKLKFNVPIISKRKQTNYYLITPMLGYQRFKGNSLTKNATLITDPGIGARASLARQMVSRNKILSWFDYWGVAFGIKNIHFKPALSSQTIDNSTLLLYNFDASINRYYTYDLSFGFKFNYIKDITIAKESTGTVGLSTINNIDLGLHADYVVWDYKKYKIVVQGGVAMIMPTQINGDSANMGTRYYSRVDGSYIRGRHVYSMGFYYSQRDQKTTSQKFSDEVFDYTAGYTYNF